MRAVASSANLVQAQDTKAIILPVAGNIACSYNFCNIGYAVQLMRLEHPVISSIPNCLYSTETYLWMRNAIALYSHGAHLAHLIVHCRCLDGQRQHLPPRVSVVPS